MLEQVTDGAGSEDPTARWRPAHSALCLAELGALRQVS